MFWSGLVTLGGKARAGSHCLSALPYSLLTEQQDETPPQATLAANSHLQPLRQVWGEDTPEASGQPDARGLLAESHSPMGQGNQARQRQWWPEDRRSLPPWPLGAGGFGEGREVKPPIPFCSARPCPVAEPGATWGSFMLRVRQTCVLASCA